ncbi:MAG: threonine/serine dehydratase [Chloroflexi bacterium]|nr:threonine/serine dehydratase [Chloroflexota bacterium]
MGPTMRQILAAQRFLSGYLPRTPLYRSAALSARTGAEVWVKYENHGPIGSFKARGALNSVASLDPATRARGIVTASTGNHGLGCAYAARLLGGRATVYVPEGANPDKVAMIREQEGEVVYHGRDVDEARAEGLRRAEAESRFFLEDGSNVPLIAGAATIALEIAQDLPHLDALFYPLGNGALVGGAGVVLRALAPGTRVVAVQSEAAPSMYLSWRERRPVGTATADTFADGIATRDPIPYAVELVNEVVDEVMLVSEAELRAGVRLLLETTHNLAEGAGAAALGGLLRQVDQYQEKTVVILLSGGNLTMPMLREILAE